MTQQTAVGGAVGALAQELKGMGWHSHEMASLTMLDGLAKRGYTLTRIDAKEAAPAYGGRNAGRLDAIEARLQKLEQPTKPEPEACGYSLSELEELQGEKESTVKRYFMGDRKRILTVIMRAGQKIECNLPEVRPVTKTEWVEVK